MKLGREVEGRHIGLLTLFMSAEEYMDLILRDRDVVWSTLQVQQVYISDHRNRLSLEGLQFELDSLTGGQPLTITVERTVVPDGPREGVDVMLVVENDEIWKLNSTDQIKISRGLDVYSMPVNQMIRTYPEDFNGDVDLG